jgi:hypothetical protein
VTPWCFQGYSVCHKAGVAAGGLPILAAAGFKALLDRRDKLKEIRDNQLYFYYRAGERLGTRLVRY